MSVSSSEKESSSKSINNTTSKKVPLRPFGTLVKNEKLSPSLPIIGLGCSSFSTFFWNKEDEPNATQQQQWGPETMDQSHPMVQEWIQTINVAIVEYGITLLDTAPWYGHGTSEVVIGWAMQDLLLENHLTQSEPPQKKQATTHVNDRPSSSQEQSGRPRRIARQELIINTKIGRYEADPNKQFDFSKEATLASVQRSLQRMKCDYINVLQLHDPEFAPSLEQLMKETIPAMVTCRSNGWCRALGMTGYPLEVQYQILQRTLDEDITCGGGGVTSGPPSPVWDQALTYGHFNLHDTSLISQPILRSSSASSQSSSNKTNHDKDNKDRPDEDDSSAIAYQSFADFCHAHSIGLMAAAPLSMGLLTKAGPPEWHPAGSDLVKACRMAVAICNDHNVNISSLATLVALSNPQIPCTVLGMKNVSEVEIAATAANRFHSKVVESMVVVPVRSTTEKKPGNKNNANLTNSSSWHNIIKQVLTTEEYNAWKLLNDPKDSPFAEVWKNGNFRWDGVQGVKEFWDQVDGVEAVAWQATTM